jgi:hypothetical protein
LYSQEIDREIKVSQRTVDENYTVDKDSIVGKFIITNLTDKVIQVTGIDKACTCSTVTVSSNEIQPQKSITLVMSVAIKGDEFIDTYSVLVLSTGQRFYRFRVKGKLILT